jgi:hypothetical protein
MARREALLPSHSARGTVRFPFTIFLSAFLLFWTQLILGKYILPWFGGTPAVWTTCMLFFQVLLLAGYSYAHLLTKYANAFTQGLVHCAILVVSVALLGYLATIWTSPITPSSDWKPLGESTPALRIIKLLAVAVGLPYFALSTTGPLLQSWFERSSDGASPYRLYSVSNLGSFLSLLAFPVLLEPRFALRTQGRIWSAAYFLFAGAAALCAVRAAANRHANTDRSRAEAPESSPVELTAELGSRDTWSRFLWFALSACASVVFLATTNQVCQDVAVVPLLWILPLGIYLLSFILCFEHPRWYRRTWFHAAFGLALFAACFVLNDGALGSIFMQAGIYFLVLFVVCMVCHGELARAKPHPRFLTSFYLTISAGGAFGGIFVGLVAPRFFRGFWEYQLGLWIAAVLLLLILVRDSGSWLYRSRIPAPVLVIAAAALLPEAGALALPQHRGALEHFPAYVAGFLIFYTYLNRNREKPEHARKKGAPLCCAAAVIMAALVLTGTGLAHVRKALLRYRNFYGTLSVLRQDSDDPTRSASMLVHGRISHGLQFRSEPYRRNPTSYYAQNSGVGLAIRQARTNAAHAGRKVRLGIVGLGVGTIAAYGQPGDALRFYEINPQVTEIASNGAYFTFLSDSSSHIEIVSGDARLSLERESDSGEFQNFDVLAIDAFSGDSVPVHLLTEEAISVYLGQLNQSGGILAFHITNTYLDLRPVIINAADHFGLNLVWVHAKGDGLLAAESDWMLLSRGELPRSGDNSSVVSRQELRLPAIRAWTDDYSNLLKILKR